MSTSCNIAYNRDGNNAGRLFLIVIFIVFVVVFFAVVVVVFLFGVTVAARAVAVGLIAVGTNVGEAILEHFFGGLCQHLPFCSFLPLLVAVRLCVLFVRLRTAPVVHAIRTRRKESSGSVRSFNYKALWTSTHSLVSLCVVNQRKILELIYQCCAFLFDAQSLALRENYKYHPQKKKRETHL